MSQSFITLFEYSVIVWITINKIIVDNYLNNANKTTVYYLYYFTFFTLFLKKIYTQNLYHHNIYGDHLFQEALGDVEGIDHVSMGAEKVNTIKYADN